MTPQNYAISIGYRADRHRTHAPYNQRRRARDPRIDGLDSCLAHALSVVHP